MQARRLHDSRPGGQRYRKDPECGIALPAGRRALQNDTLEDGCRRDACTTAGREASATAWRRALQLGGERYRMTPGGWMQARRLHDSRPGGQRYSLEASATA